MNLFNGFESKIHQGSIVFVKTSKVERIGKQGDTIDEIIDGMGYYLMPGMIDAHSHMDNLASSKRALESATVLAAELLVVDKTTGRIDKGYDADFVLIPGNPLKEIRYLQDALLVMSKRTNCFEKNSVRKIILKKINHKETFIVILRLYTYGTFQDRRIHQNTK